MGYYSILSNGKNYITVGNVHKDDTILSYHSSLGPTRDGRIKPDIVAPGSESKPYPGRNRRYPTTVEIDYIRILDSTGTVKYSWEFTNGTDGWGVNRVLDSTTHWGGLERSEVTAPVHLDSVIRFQATSRFNSYFWSDSIPLPIRMGNHDTLSMRLRFIQPFPSDYSFPYMAGGLYWKRLDSAVYDAGHLPFTYHFSDSNFFQVKQPLVGWSSEDTLLALRLDFLGDTAEYGIVTADTLPLAGPLQHYYTRAEGTSMAAPHVTGIIALMLDKFNRDYLKPRGLNVHDNAFWNSTAKAILIHSAIDLAYDGDPRAPENPDIGNFDPGHGASVKYFPGPDFATGYGLVNAPGAVHFVDTTLFKEDSLDHTQERVYEFDVNQNVHNLRVTLAWDDYPGNPDSPPDSPKLINDLDLVVEDPQGDPYLPWVLRGPPQILPVDSSTDQLKLPSNGLDPIDSADIQPAQRGFNHLDNVEVVDAQSYGYLPHGKWRIRVKGTRVAWGPQDYSVVADFPITRDSLVMHPSDLLFHFDVGHRITSRTALRTQDSTVYFAARGSYDSLFAYSISRHSIRWAYAPVDNYFSTDPIMAGNRLYFVIDDSLYCIRDDGDHATRIWSRRLMPDDDSGNGKVGDTAQYYSRNRTFAPSVDVTQNRLYSFCDYTRYTRVNVSGSPPSDSLIGVSFFQIFWTFDLDGNLIGQAEPFSPISSAASSGPNGGFFSGDSGWTYKVHPQGYLLGYARFFGKSTSLIHQPVIGPNGTVYVQGGASVVGFNSVTGDSLVAFSNQDLILSNSVIDEFDNLHLVGYHRYSQETRYLVYSPSGVVLVDAFLGKGKRTIGELALGSAGRAYFVMDGQGMELNYSLSNPIADAHIYPHVFVSEGKSPDIGNGYVIFADGNEIDGFSALSDGLSDGWARSGKDNGNTGNQPLGVPGFSPLPVGAMSTVTTGSWNDSRSRYDLCGSSSGIGGNEDDLELAFTYTSGDFEYTASLTLLDASHPSARAGLMAMTGTDGRSRNGFIWLSAANTAGFTWRDSVGGATTAAEALGTYVPGKAWVKLRRIGSTLSGFISQNGLHYTHLGSVDIGTGRIYVGLAHTTGTLQRTGCAEFSGIATGTAQPKALFVVGDTALASIDTAIDARLSSLGYTVTVRSGPDSRTSDADFKDIVVISSTVNSSDVSTKFRTVEVPVLDWEQALSDDLGMTGTVAGTDQGTLAGQTQIQILDASHPLAAGKSGTVPVYVSSSVLSWGKPNANAVTVATIVGDPGKAVIYGYEQGTGMVSQRAPARRVGFFLENAPGLGLTPDGQALFDAAVHWATGSIAPSALFVVGNVTLNTGDQAVFNRLAGKGYAVTVKTGATAQTADANGKNLVLLSSTVTSNDVGTKFTNGGVPVLNWEPLLSDDLGMTGNGQGTWQGTSASQTEVTLLASASPAAARLSGTVLATTTPQVFTWGKPNSNAVTVASLAADTTRKTAFGYERGAAMVAGTAPARRYAFFLNDATAAALADSGQALVDAAVAWTTGGFPAAPEVAGVLGMENLPSWSTPDALLSLSPNRTEGNSSIQVDGGGYMLLTSTPMHTQDIIEETSTLRLDVYVPGNQPNPYWVGAVQMYAECPSAGAYNVYLGEVELTGLPRNQFSTVNFTVPAEVLDILRGNHSDFVFKIALNVNEGVEPSLFDNLRFYP